MDSMESIVYVSSDEYGRITLPPELARKYSGQNLYALKPDPEYRQIILLTEERFWDMRRKVQAALSERDWQKYQRSTMRYVEQTQVDGAFLFVPGLAEAEPQDRLLEVWDEGSRLFIRWSL